MVSTRILDQRPWLFPTNEWRTEQNTLEVLSNLSVTSTYECSLTKIFVFAGHGLRHFHQNRSEMSTSVCSDPSRRSHAFHRRAIGKHQLHHLRPAATTGRLHRFMQTNFSYINTKRSNVQDVLYHFECFSV